MFKTIILSFGLLSLMNCNAQKEPKTSAKTNVEKTGDAKITNQKSDIIYFTEGENKFFKEAGMNLTFKGISEDSRCPKDVNCIWAGVAVAQVEVMGLATRPMTINLASTDNKSRNYSTTSEFNGYTISLADVAPYPEAAEGTKALKGKYKIGIIIKKAGENPTKK